MRTTLCVALAVLGGSVPVGRVMAQGVHLSVGAGGGVGSWSIGVDGRPENSGTFTFVTDFEIGLAVSRSLTVYYLNRTAWFSSDVTVLPGPFGGPLTPQVVARVLTQGISGVGVTVRPSTDVGALYLSGGAGLAWWSQVFEESVDCLKFPLVVPCIDVSGIGVTAGVGYALSRFFDLKVVGLWGRPTSDDPSRFDVLSSTSAVSAVLTLNVF